MMDLERMSPAAGHWSHQQYGSIFGTGHQRPSGRVAWVAEDDCEQPEKAPRAVLGFMVAAQVDAEWELENVVVAATARRRGVGTRLVTELFEHARSRNGSAIFLEVRESNQGARAMYRRAGFQETGLRKSYYANPPEDAILCRLSLY